MHVHAVTEVAGLYHRLILFGSHDRSIQFDARSSVIVDARNIDVQQLLLENGYVGVEPCGDVGQIRYCKPLDERPETSVTS
jgi:hypothetical protein